MNVEAVSPPDFVFKVCVVFVSALAFLAALPMDTAVVQSVSQFATWTGAERSARMLANSPGQMQLWDTDLHVALRTFDNDRDGVLSPDGRFIAANNAFNGDIDILATADGRSVARVIAGSNEPQAALAIAPDDERVAIDRPLYGSPYLVVVDASTGRVAYTLKSAGGGAAFSPDGQTLATLDAKRRALLLWSARNGHFLKRLRGDAGVFGPPLFSPDGRYVVTVANEPRTPPHGDGSFAIDSTAYPKLDLEVWDLHANRVVQRRLFSDDAGRTYDEHQGFYAFIDATHLLFTLTHGQAQILALSSGRVTSIDGRGVVVRSGVHVELIADDTWLQLARQTLRTILRFSLSFDVTNVAVAADGRVAVANENTLVVWDLANATVMCDGRFTGQTQNVVVNATSADANHDRPPATEANSQTCVSLRSVGDTVSSTVRSADGTRELTNVAAAAGGHSANVFELRQTRSKRVLATIENVTGAGVFALRAPIVAVTMSSGQRIVLFNALSGERLHDFPNRSAFALSPDGEQLAVASQTETIVYSTRSGNIRATYPYADRQFSFLPNGKYLIGEAGKLVWIHTLDGKPLARLPVAVTKDGEINWAIALSNGDYTTSINGAGLIAGGRSDAAAVRHALYDVLR